MDDDTFDSRLATASDRLSSLRARLVAGEPWPLATRFDHAPEASWGPPETLAHVEEMLGYWLGEAERVLAMTGGPEAFGRVATDTRRLAVIERDRKLPIGELLERTEAGVARWRDRWAQLDDAERGRTGLHPTRGAMSVSDIATRFVAGHLEDHIDQLEASLRDEAAMG